MKNYALIGFGGIAENRIAKEGFACDRKRFAPSGKVRLVGATNRSESRRAAVEALGIRWYGSVDEILQDPKIDGVFIATNNATHAELTMRALKAGKHVIVEKPMATTLTDARKMVRLAKKKGLSLMADQMMVENAWNIAARKVVAGGRLGTVNDCRFHMEFAYGFTPKEAAQWRCNNVNEMGGPIGDVASHCFYMAEFITGKRIRAVAATYYPKILKIKAEDGAYIRIFFEDGTIGSVSVSFSEQRGGRNSLTTLTNLGYEVYGEKGTMRGYGTMFQLSGHGDEPIRQRLELDFRGKAEEVAVENARNIYAAIIERHAASMDNPDATAGVWLDALHNLALCKASHGSAMRGGKCVAVKV